MSVHVSNKCIFYFLSEVNELATFSLDGAVEQL